MKALDGDDTGVTVRVDEIILFWTRADELGKKAAVSVLRLEQYKDHTIAHLEKMTSELGNDSDESRSTYIPLLKSVDTRVIGWLRRRITS